MINMDSPWRSARLEFEHRILPQLERVGKEIGVEASAGDATAQQIVNLYAMLHRSFDPLTMLRLDDALADWIAKHNAPTGAQPGAVDAAPLKGT